MPEKFLGKENLERSKLLKELDAIFEKQRAVFLDIRQTIANASSVEEAEKAVFEEGGLATKFEELQQKFVQCLGEIAGHKEE